MANPNPNDTKNFRYGIFRGEPPEAVINASARWKNVREELVNAHAGDWIAIPVEVVNIPEDAPETANEEEIAALLEKGIARARTAAFGAAEKLGFAKRGLYIETRKQVESPTKATVWVEVKEAA